MSLQIFSEIPIWGMILIGIGSAFLSLCMLFCILKYVTRMRRKKKKKPDKLGLANSDYLGLFYNERVQPDVDAVDGDDKEAGNKLGRLHFSLDYDFTKEELIVGIMELSELRAMDANGSSDPYVRQSIFDTSYVTIDDETTFNTFVFLFPEKKKKFDTKVYKRTLNPVFAESFNFKVSFQELHQKTLVMTAFDYDRFSKHDVIGQVTLQMKDVDVTQVIDKWVPLMPDDKETNKEVVLGDVCFSLRYVPTSGKLTIVIIEAKNLKKMDVHGLSDPFVKISLYSGSKKVKKKKTSVKKKTLNPYFNEDFTFDLSFDQMQKASLLITVMDHDKLSSADEIGHVRLSLKSSGTELKHWTEMLTYPRKAIVKWHQLKRDE